MEGNFFITDGVYKTPIGKVKEIKDPDLEDDIESRKIFTEPQELKCSVSLDKKAMYAFLKAIGVLPIGAPNNAYKRIGQPMRRKLTYQRRNKKIDRLISKPLKHRQRVKVRELKRAYEKYILGHEEDFRKYMQQEEL